MADTTADVVARLARDWPQVTVELRSGHQGFWHLDRIEVPDGQRRAGTGTAVLTAICDAADAAGATLVCTPATDWGSSRAGLDRFYRRAGFRPNRGRHRDLRVRETMLREPQ